MIEDDPKAMAVMQLLYLAGPNHEGSLSELRAFFSALKERELREALDALQRRNYICRQWKPAAHGQRGHESWYSLTPNGLALVRGK